VTQRRRRARPPPLPSDCADTTPDAFAQGVACCDVVDRGLAVADGHAGRALVQFDRMVGTRSTSGRCARCGA
jgi:hypothetical protein